MTQADSSMARVVEAVAPILKTAGFRKRRYGFNCSRDDGVVQVVHFQMGSKLPPGASAVPPFRMDMYGKFTINLGVYMPALARQLLLPMPKGWINQYDCHLRQRIGMLFADPADTWWSLADADLAAEVAREAVSHFALPWLESVSTVDDIHRRYLTHGGHAVGLGVGAPLQIALLYIDRGEIDVAEHILRDFLAGDLTVPHRRHVAELLPRYGLGYLVTE